MVIAQNVSLKDFNNYKIGGNASYFLEIDSEKHLIEGLNFWHNFSRNFNKEERQIFILGDGTNILFPDEGLKGLVLKNSIKGISILNNYIEVGSGTDFSELVAFCLENSLSGLEWAGGMPGTVGGAIRGNAGAYGGETKDSILEVVSIGLNTTIKIIRSREECLFDYRSSIFKSQTQDKDLIVFAKFAFKKGDKNTIYKLTQEKINHRKMRHPLEYPNVGSVFKNVSVDKFSANQLKDLAGFVKDDPVPVVPAAKLIFLSGLMGQRVGDVMVSQKHTNFLVNLGNGTALDAKRLIEIVKRTVREKFSVELEEEILIV